MDAGRRPRGPDAARLRTSGHVRRCRAETFVEPTTLASVHGELDVTLTLAYVDTMLDGKPVQLRTMFGSIPAPTLRVDVGDRLRISVINQLPPNPPSTEPADASALSRTAPICTRTACT